MLNRVRTFLRLLGVGFALAVVPLTVGHAADPRFGRYFSDDMVLQRDKPTVIRGTADKGASVTVAFAGQRHTATAGEDGRWSVTLDPLKAEARPQTLSLSGGGKTVTLQNVVVGDVLLMARQTSIDVTLGGREDGRQEAAGYAADPRLRAIRIATLPAARPQSDLAPEATTGWATVDKDTALKMSAAAFHLGRGLAGTAEVPVGIIDLDMGPIFPVGWLSREALEETEKFFGRSDVPGQLTRFDQALEALARGEPLGRKDVLTADMIVEHPMFPSGGYNAVLVPLMGLGLKAAILQLGNDYPYMIYAALEKEGKRFDRGELNRAYVQTYDIRKVGFRMEPVTLPRVPRIWRQTLGQTDLPLGLIVPPGSGLKTLSEHHREMRELQRLMAEDNPHVGVILPGSENVPFSAQPADEALLARRCLAWVRAAVYGAGDAPATGPLLDRLEGNFNEATIHFKPGTAGGLRATGDALDYFEAAGVEGDYSPVSAVIVGETIRLSSTTVDRIARVRYNWNGRPNQSLVNAAGLPALPFRTERAAYHWFVTNEDSDLPVEYSTPANQWQPSDVTLVNGQMETFGYDNFSGWLGPIGVKVGPFGPNMGVREVKPGSPADGKLLPDDMIYSANGKMVGDRAWEVMADAITDSETRQKQGKLVLSVRRDGKNLDVPITLAVMGEYSPTAPFDCPKTEKIISNLVQWVVARGAGEGFLNTDAIFLLATGDPTLQGYVRRVVYDTMAEVDITKPIEPTKAGKSWFNSADAFLLGEYYMATGDRNVLEHLQYFCDRLAATQNALGGWRHNFPGGDGYGLIPNAGLPGVMGMHFATEAGLPINQAAFQLGVKHFGQNRAETGYLIYGLGGCERPVPVPFNPDDFSNGRLNSYNGGLSAAGILMRLVGNHRAAHLSSLISAYAWNNTFEGHGGNFWNNFWTPLGANDHGRSAFINFWKHYRWYRELNRVYDGSIIQHENGRVGAGCGVALVAPRRRIQIVGAPLSPFSTRAPELLKPALEAYWKKDYAGCQKLVDELVASGWVGKDDMPTVQYLGRQARDIRASIEADLSRMNSLLEAGRLAEVKDNIPQLKGVMPEGDARLAALETATATTKADPRRKGTAEQDDEAAAATAGAAKTAPPAPPRQWECLVTEIATEQSKAGKDLYGPGKVDPDKASLWRVMVVENLAQAPEGWTRPDFADAHWEQTHLPISWRMYHTALLRTTFEVPDKEAFDLLRFRGWLFRQQGIEIYLNGQIIGKVNNLEQKTGNVSAEFKASALKHLRNGTNTLAVTTRHNWRWGMLSMHVYNDGFGFRLDARKK